jgi:hypothetical protein
VRFNFGERPWQCESPTPGEAWAGISAAAEGDTPLKAAVAAGHADAALLLLRRTSLEELQAADDRGDTMAHRAAVKGHTATVEALLAAGVDKNIQNKVSTSFQLSAHPLAVSATGVRGVRARHGSERRPLGGTRLTQAPADGGGVDVGCRMGRLRFTMRLRSGTRRPWRCCWRPGRTRTSRTRCVHPSSSPLTLSPCLPRVCVRGTVAEEAVRWYAAHPSAR